MNNLCITLGWLTGRRIAAMRTLREPWELLFEGDVTTETNDGGTTYGTFKPALIQFNTEDPPDSERVYRLTVDGVPVEQIVAYEENATGESDIYYVGNVALMSIEYDNIVIPDDGTDFCIFAYKYPLAVGGFVDKTFFLSRAPGTYHVKVERLLKDPVAYSYNGTRLPALPELETGNYHYITRTDNGTMILRMSTRALYFPEHQVIHPDAALDTGSTATVTCCHYNPAQWHTDWVRYPDGDAELAWREEYPIPGETLIWSNMTVITAFRSGEVVMEGSRAMPIFEYKEW